jgi:hypothetical protein
VGGVRAEWLWTIHDIDGDAEIAQLDDDSNGNPVYEVSSAADLSPVRKVRGVVNVELQ